MAAPYQPGQAPTQEEVVPATWEELRRIADALLLLENSGVHFDPLAVVPQKDVHALTVYAVAGVLGTHEGLYRYDSSGVWIYVGIGGYDSIGVPAVTDPTYTVLDTDGVILLDATSNDIDVTHITAVGEKGRSFVFKRIDTSSNDVTVDASGAETIDRDPNFNLYPDEVVKTISDNSNWWII